MAQGMMVIRPTEPSSLLTTMKELVAPLVAMFASVASSSSRWMDAEDSLPDAHGERMEVKKKGVSYTSLTEGLIDTANKHQAKYPTNPPPKTIFFFSAQEAKVEVDLESKILTCTISCDSPPENMKNLTTAIHHGFGPELTMVKIIVSEKTNEFEMEYAGMTILKCEMEAAESLIHYAVGAARIRWLQILQQQLINEWVPRKREADKRCMESRDFLNKLAREEQVGLQEHALSADYIDLAFFAGTTGCSLDKRIVNSDDWGKKLTEELVHRWLEGSFSRGKWVAQFRCSGSIKYKRTQGSTRTIFFFNFQDYIGSQLQKHTRQNYYEPNVIIRMIDRSSSFMKVLVPFTDKTCVIEFLDQATGNWMSISDADGPGLRRILLCRSSNFHEVFSDFLTTTDIFKSKNYELLDRSAFWAEESGMKGSRSPIDESFQSRVTHLESKELEMGRLPGTSLTDDSMEIASKHVEENLDEQPETSPFIIGSSYRELPDISAFCAQTLSKLEERSSSPIDENIQSGVTHFENMAFEVGRGHGTSLTDDSMEIASKHMEENLDEQPETSPFIIGSSKCESPDKSSFSPDYLADLAEAL